MMNINVGSVMEMGQLAQLAYGEFDVELVENEVINGTFTVDGDKTVTLSNRYRIEELESTSSSMDAVLLQRIDENGNDTGEYVISFRGSQQPLDFLNDFPLIPIQNWSPIIGDALEFVVRATDDHAIPLDKLTLTGHSLGGIIVQMASAEYQIDGYAYNPYGASLLQSLPGVPFPLSNVLGALMNAFGISNVNSDWLDEHLINVSYQDEGDINGDVLSNFLTNFSEFAGNSHLGGFLPIFGPEVGLADGHSMDVLNDAIAHYNDILEKFTPTTTMSDLSRVHLVAGYSRTESELAALSISNAVDDTLSLDHLTVDDIEDGILPKPHSDVVDIASEDSPTGLAYRYALSTLLPFTITGDESLFDSFNTNGELDLSNLTDSYLYDRALMLEAITQRNIDGATHPDSINGQTIRFWDSEIGEVFAGGNTNGQGNSNTVDPDTVTNILFGSANTDTLDGKSQGDYLYGMGGDDELYGHDGDDYLEGGLGDDSLKGGKGDDILVGFQGADTFVWENGDGDDVIVDYDDGGDSITVNGVDLATLNFVQTSPDSTYYHDPSNPDISLHHEGGSLTIYAGSGEDAGSIKVTQYYPGAGQDYGIVLDDTPDAPDVGTTYVVTALGSAEDEARWDAYDRDRTEQGEINWQDTSIYFDANSVTNYTGGSLYGTHEGAFFGGPVGDELVGNAGQNALHGWAGDDVLAGGDNADYLEGGAGSDYIEGGAGSDILFGSAAQNTIDWTEDEDTRAEFYRPQAKDQEDDINILSGEGGDDFLSGGEFRDYLDGGSGADYLLGGTGRDFMSGGSENDVIYGDSSLNWKYEYHYVGEELDYISFEHLIKFADGTDSVGEYNDTIHAGAGDDVVWGELGDDEIYGGGGDDELIGDRYSESGYPSGGLPADDGTSPELAVALHGNDKLYGGEGNDLLIGLAGDDHLYGNEDDDELQGGLGNDHLYGGEGVDTLFGEAGDDHLEGGDGADELYAGLGDDHLQGGAGDDTLLGGGGSDNLDGGDGNDHIQDYWDSHAEDQNTLSGGAGDDLIISGLSVDTLRGGDGNDTLFAGDGNDTLYGGGGNLDYLLGEGGNDIFVGGAGTDYMYGGNGNDTYQFQAGDGRDGIRDTAGNNSIVLEGVSADDVGLFVTSSSVIFTYGNDDAVYLSRESLSSTTITFDGIEYGASELWALIHNQQASLDAGLSSVRGAGFSSTTAWFGGQLVTIDSGTAGIDPNDPATWLLNGAVSLTGALVFYTNASGDAMAGVPAGDGTYLAPAGAVTEHTLLPDGTLLSREPNFATEADLVASTDGESELPTGAEGDTSGVNPDDEVTEGTASGDTLDGGAGADLIRGEGGDDDLDGGTGNDVLFGDAGNDAVAGDSGDDTLYGGDGADSLVGGEGNDSLNGDAGNDDLSGGSGNDLLTGGAGNDTLSGGAGSDTYFFALGHGQDTVDNSGDTGTSVITFAEDISPEEVTATRDGDDLVLSVDGGDSVTVTGYFLSDAATERAVDRITFNSDQTAWTIDDIKAIVTIGDATDNTLYGYDNSDDVIAGLAGSDVLYGGAGDDELDGGDGVDELHGGAGDDVLIGGSGDDTLTGGSGSDTYVIRAGDGHDTVDNSSDTGSSTIAFAEEILPEDVAATRSGDDLVLDIAGTDSVTVTGYFAGDATTASAVDQISFNNDQTTWSVDDVKAFVLIGDDADNIIHGFDNSDDVISGGAGNDVLHGGAGQDTLNGGVGNDTLAGESGDDVYVVNSGGGDDQIVDLAGENNSLQFGPGILPQDVVATRVGDDLLLSLENSTSSISIANYFGAAGETVSSFVFEDGTEWGLAQVRQFVLVGTSGADTLNGFDTDDTLNGQGGDDELAGGIGNDTYIFSNGDGADLINDQGGTADSIEFVDANPADVVLRRDGNDLLITNSVSGDSILVEAQFSAQPGEVSTSAIDNIVFADATTWDDNTIKQQALAGTANADEIYGHADADTIYAGAGDDTVFGELGADTIYGQAGVDTLYGNQGDDEIHGGDGNDIIDDDLGSNTLYGGAGEDQITGNGSLYGDEDNDTLSGSGLLDGGAGNDQITGAGSDTLVGGSGDDVITAYSDPFTQNSNTLEGGTGDDTLFGSFGNDEYRFVIGDGQDIVTERRQGEDYSNITPSADTVVFGAGISQADLQLERHGNDLVIHYGTGTDEILVTDWYSGVTDHFKINTIQFNDGTSLSLADIEAQVITHGTAGDDVLQGYRSLDDTINAGDGNDQVWGGDGHDTLMGGAGDDYLDGDAGDDMLEGGAGADTLVGRSGADTLVGGTGDDSYVYIPGSGSDLIINSDGGYDGLFFNDGIDRDRLTFEQDGDDLLVLVDDDPTQSVRVQDHFLGGNHAIDFVQPDGGYLMDTVEIDQIVAAGNSEYDSVIEGTASDEQLVGTAGRDLINGLAGSDTLFGMAGDDELQGGEGSDYLSGGNGSGAGSGNDVLFGGNGNDTLSGEDGDDSLHGGLGDDSYYYTAAGGVDTIDNSGGGFDGIFTLDSVGRDRLSFHQEGDDLVILVDADLAQQVRVTNHFLGGDSAISFVQPDDGGASILAADIPALLEALPDDDGGTGGTPGGGENPPAPETGGDDVINGTVGNDILLGGEGDDTLHGDSGNDTLIGGAGDDTYLFSGGQDTLDNREGGTDILRFIGGITFSEVSSYLTKSGNDLILSVNGGPDQVTLSRFFLGGDYLIENIEFETGGSLTAQQIFNAFGLSIPAVQAPFDTTVEGTTGDDAALSGSSDSDLIRGGNGDDLLQGDDSDDRLEGGNGSDTLEGEAGNDVLLGGRGDDTYIFHAGDGQDVIDNSGGGNDTLNFEGINFNQVSSGLVKSGNDLILDVSGGSDSVTLKDWFLGGDFVVDTIGFAAGGSITSGQIFGAFGLSNPDATGSPDYPSLPDERSYANLVGANTASHTIVGSSDADFIDAGAGDDVIDGGAGGDYLMGGDGNDTYLVLAGGGQDTINNLSNNPTADTDILQFGAGFDEDDLWFSREGDDLLVDVIGSDEQVTIQDWYSDDDQKIDEFHTDDAVLQADLVENLVNAMAAFGTPPAGEAPLPQGIRDTIEPVIAANWQVA